METRTIVKKITKSIDLKFSSLDDYNRSVFGDQTWVDELKKTMDQITVRVDNGLFQAKEGLKEIAKTLAMESKIDKTLQELGISPTPEYLKGKEKIRIIQKQVSDFNQKLQALNK